MERDGGPHPDSGFYYSRLFFVIDTHRLGYFPPTPGLATLQGGLWRDVEFSKEKAVFSYSIDSRSYQERVASGKMLLYGWKELTAKGCEANWTLRSKWEENLDFQAAKLETWFKNY
jgi:hypothetical protein